MSRSSKPTRPLRRILLGLGLLVALGITGCQAEIGGQSLPSPYWMTDDVQYFAPGPEFKLAKEAAALKAARAEQNLQKR
jgi:hypothetical protein